MSRILEELLRQRILILDGAMGTMIQRYGLKEEDFRGEEFSSHPVKLLGNNDILSITRPEIIAALHREYLEAGADIIESCTFNSQSISQADYAMGHLVRRLNLEACKIARSEADRMSRLTPSKPRFVAGSVGPTGKSASISPDVDNPAKRSISFDQLVEAYSEQIEALAEGGVDMLLFETIFDTLNLKAATTAAEAVFARTGERLPIMISATIADAAGRTLSGQTMESLLCSIAHIKPLSIGLNCSFGAEQMTPYLRELSHKAPFYISAYPNAGIPDQMGEYSQSPDQMAEQIALWAKEGLVNIVGGCCGSTPQHIAAIAHAVESISPRTPHAGKMGWLAGLDAMEYGGEFINVGERCNVAGSRKFLRLIKEKSYDEALSIARSQVRAGAMILDINMDDAMIDASAEMCNFINLMGSDPEIARLPFMVDSSRYEVIEAALKCIQGKAIVNSLSLKEGEEIFLQRAKRVKELGAALVVMAFDEQGQATCYERKIEVCSRAYQLLTQRVGFEARDIIFDPNVLTIATGIKEHDNYALDFIRATRWIKENLPHAKVSGGVSNLSFALRGNNYLREAMHAVFLYHAIEAGLTMAIVNPSTAVMYEDIPLELREVLEDVVLNRREDATERLLSLAEQYREQPLSAPTLSVARDTIPLEERLISALQHGDEEHLEEDLQEALNSYSTPAEIIEKPLMQGMTRVGELFGAGKMFLPQVVKTARTMKRAVEILQPHLEAQNSASEGKCGRYLLATVKGDVHDIGKNIAAVILACNNFEVFDLGVMTPPEKIVAEAIAHKVDFIALSGLITPSLEEMCRVAEQLDAAGVSIPLFISGATTSPLHTAIKIAPLYRGAVFHLKDASQNPIYALRLMGEERDSLIAELKSEQERLREEFASAQRAAEVAQEQCAESAHSKSQRIAIDWSAEERVSPSYLGVRSIEDIKIEDVRPYINWAYFYKLWRIKPQSQEAEELLKDANAMLDELAKRHTLCSRVGFFAAHATEEGIIIEHPNQCECGCTGAQRHTLLRTPRQTKANREGLRLSLCDFVAPEGFNDHIGAFALTLSKSFIEELEKLKSGGNDYSSLLMQSLGDRLAEAASEWLHTKVRRELWGYAASETLSVEEIKRGAYRGIRPAVGYPSLPDQSEIFHLAELLNVENIGIRLTENGAMYPQASICGVYIASRHARYFIIED